MCGVNIRILDSPIDFWMKEFNALTVWSYDLTDGICLFRARFYGLSGVSGVTMMLLEEKKTKENSPEPYAYLCALQLLPDIKALNIML